MASAAQPEQVPVRPPNRFLFAPLPGRIFTRFFEKMASAAQPEQVRIFEIWRILSKDLKEIWRIFEIRRFFQKCHEVHEAREISGNFREFPRISGRIFEIWRILSKDLKEIWRIFEIRRFFKSAMRATRGGKFPGISGNFREDFRNLEDFK